MEDKSKGALSLCKSKFACGPSMQNQWVERSSLFLTCVTAKFGKGMIASLLSGEIVVTEVDEGLTPKFDTEYEEKEHLADLKHWERKLHHSTLEDCTKFNRAMLKDLASACGILFGFCDVSMHNLLEAEPEH